MRIVRWLAIGFVVVIVLILALAFIPAEWLEEAPTQQARSPRPTTVRPIETATAEFTEEDPAEDGTASIEDEDLPECVDEEDTDCFYYEYEECFDEADPECVFFDEEDLFWDETPDDCYPDEVFDYDLDMCILAEDADEFLEEYPDDSYEETPDSIFEEDPTEAFIMYEVKGDELHNPELIPTEDQTLEDYQRDLQLQQETWRYFATLIPEEYRTNITQFGFFSDGSDETLAWAMPNETNIDEWIIGIDLADSVNPTDLTATLLHEYAHVMTLSTDQGEYEPEYECEGYLSDTWCAYDGSYLQDFVYAFWGDIQGEWEDIQALEDQDEFDTAMYEFYEYYEDQFVSEYATTSPDEDIAETWAEFILNPAPDGDTIAEQKILFFYEYPELVELREIIAPRAASRIRR